MTSEKVVFESWQDLANWTFSVCLPLNQEMKTVNRPLLLVLQQAFSHLKTLMLHMPTLKPFVKLCECNLACLERVLMDPVIEESLQGCLDTLCLEELSSMPFTQLKEQMVIFQGLLKSSLLFSKTSPSDKLLAARTGLLPTTSTQETVPLITCTSFTPVTPNLNTQTVDAGPSHRGDLWDSSDEEAMDLSPRQLLEKTCFYIYQKVKPIIIVFVGAK